MPHLKHFLVSLILFCPLSVYAQEVDFCFSEGDRNTDIINGMCIDEDGATYAVGYFYDNTVIGGHSFDGHVDSPYWAKFDPSGRCVWAKTMLDNPGFFDYANGVCLGKNGSFYMTGSFRGTIKFEPTKSLLSFDGEAMFLAKYDTSGTCTWLLKAAPLVHNNTSPVQSQRGTKVIEDEKGNVYVAGTFVKTCYFEHQGGDHSDTAISEGDKDVYVAKYSSTGTCLGVFKLGGTKSDEAGDIVYSDGHLYLTGSFTDSCLVNGTRVHGVEGINGFVLKLDTTMNSYDYIKPFGGPNSYNLGTGISRSAEGSVYVTGILFGASSYDGGLFLNGSAYHSFLCKLDSETGQLLWAQPLDGPGLVYSYSLSSNSNSDAFVTGTFMYDLPLNNGDVLSNTGTENNVFLIKFDRDGQVKWSKQSTGTGGKEGRCVVAREDMLHVAGHYGGDFNWGSYTFSSNNGSSDFFISAVQDHDPIPTGVQESSLEKNFHLYPNPASDAVYLNLPASSQEGSTVRVFSTEGVLMHSEDCKSTNSNSSLRVNTSTFPKGLYVVEVSSSNGLWRQKLVIH